jgi:hypothetical protein
LLPFPFPNRAPDRFKLDKDGYFEFYGRPKFRELYDVVSSMFNRGSQRYYFHGTLGAGKSHLLAALACLLMSEGKLVVFIPDCNELLADPAEYFGAALELAYDDNELFGPELKALRLHRPEESTALERLTQFCWEVAKNGDCALFIVDQANALDDAPPGMQRFHNDKKQVVRSLLDTSSAAHMKLASSTANYKHAMTDRYRETSEKRIDLYYGLNEVSGWVLV